MGVMTASARSSASPLGAPATVRSAGPVAESLKQGRQTLAQRRAGRRPDSQDEPLAIRVEWPTMTDPIAAGDLLIRELPKSLRELGVRGGAKRDRSLAGGASSP
jgi:hypothetical protein